MTRQTNEYADGTIAFGVAPLPELSPREQALQEALMHLDSIEAVMGGRNGPSIQLRTLIITLAF